MLKSTNGKEKTGKGKSEEIEEEEGIQKSKTKEYSLIFVVVKRFAQPRGINLPQWEGETKKGIVHLLPVAEQNGQNSGLATKVQFM